MFNNFYPKIYAIASCIFSILIITKQYLIYPDAVEVPDYMDVIYISFVALFIIFIFSGLVFGFLLVPLSCYAEKYGSLTGIGTGFTSYEFEELEEQGRDEIEEDKRMAKEFNEKM